MSSPAVLEIQSPSSMHWCSPADRRHPWASRRSRTPFGSKVIKDHSIDWNCSILFWGGYDLKQISSVVVTWPKYNIASKYLQNLNISTHRHLGSKHFHCRVGGIDVLQHLRINGKLHIFGKHVQDKTSTDKSLLSMYRYSMNLKITSPNSVEIIFSERKSMSPIASNQNS